MSNLKRLTGNFSSLTTRRRGQILVVVAMAMLVMLITAGLATDVGILLMRKAQFDRAVDGAALAGAPKVASGVEAANDRGRQILTANGIAIPAGPADNECPLGANEDYCGKKEPGSLPGAQRYRVEARWRVPLAFMQLAKINDVTLTSSAVAEYLDTVDTFTSESDQSIIQTSNLELFGPQTCTGQGDPYSPLEDASKATGSNDDYVELNGVYTYRIAIPPTYLLNKVRVELLDPQTGNTGTVPSAVYKTNGSPGPSPSCGDRRDPCVEPTGDAANAYWFIRMDENRYDCATGPTSYDNGDQYNTRTLFRLYYYKQLSGGGLVPVDLAYYLGKKDDAGSQTGSGRYSIGTWTAVQTHDEAQAEAVATMLQWISPGAPASERMPVFTNTPSGINSTVNGLATVIPSPAEPPTETENCNSVRQNLEINNFYLTAFPVSLASSCVGNGDFIVDLENEASDIYEDPGTQVRHLYLDVRALSGGSENNWAVWAGPALSDAPTDDETYKAPSDLNSRQIYLLRHKNRTPASSASNMHSSQGIVTYGVGHLPMNSVANNRVRFPLAYLGPEFAGQELTIKLFDADTAGTEKPVIFYLDTIPQSIWEACYIEWANRSQCVTPDEGGYTGGWVSDADNWKVSDAWGTYKFTIPSDEGTPRVPFYGGRLMIYYKGGEQDSFGWKVTVGARPTLVQ